MKLRQLQFLQNNATLLWNGWSKAVPLSGVNFFISAHQLMHYMTWNLTSLLSLGVSPELWRTQVAGVLAAMIFPRSRISDFRWNRLRKTIVVWLKSGEY